MTTITRRRPGIPIEYGISQDDEGMLDWPDVAAALGAATIFWLSTVRPDGSPHLVPIWGVFVDDAAYFEGGDMTRWARNLAEGDGSIHIGVDHDGMQAMVRGTAAWVEVDPEPQTRIADAYDAKYPYRPEGHVFWRLAPDSVVAWRVNDPQEFAATPTQFDFGGSE